MNQLDHSVATSPFCDANPPVGSLRAIDGHASESVESAAGGGCHEGVRASHEGEVQQHGNLDGIIEACRINVPVIASQRHGLQGSTRFHIAKTMALP